MLTLRRQNDLRPFFNDFFGDLLNDDFFFPVKSAKNENYIPALNIKEDEKAINMELIVPGFKKDDIKISLEGDLLTISSEKKEEKEEKGDENKNDNFIKREFSYSSFKRCIRVPEDKIDTEKIAANYEDGVLRLNIPKKEKAVNPSRLIDIK